jgi:hypothetical protein
MIYKEDFQHVLQFHVKLQFEPYLARKIGLERLTV